MIFKGTKNWTCEDNLNFSEGGNSFLYLVKNDGLAREYALKLYKCDDLASERYNRFLSEIEIVKTISNVNGCVKYEDHGLYEGRPFYVMPYYENGTFRSEFLTPKGNEYNALDKLDAFLKVLQIVKSLHDDGLAIRDIKPQNILLDCDNDPVIADFGLSLWLNTCDDDRHTVEGVSVGSQGYRPPEWASVYPDPNHRPGDIWSLGRTLWAIVAGKNPPNNYETLGGNGTHLKLYVSKDFANLVQSITTSCTSQTPSQRPNISELISHVSSIRDDVNNIETQQDTVKVGIRDSLRVFATQLKNSEAYIDSKREELETNIRLNEMSESMTLLNEALSNLLPDFEALIDSKIGSFRVFDSDWEMMHSLRSSGLTVDCSDNDLWNKSVCIRFDPSESLEQHKDMSYVCLTFHMGFTKEKEFYWLIASRDQTNINEYIAEQFETKSLINIVNNKLNQLDSFVIQHFLKRVEENFKA